jgi:hypothetical protein
VSWWSNTSVAQLQGKTFAAKIAVGLKEEKGKWKFEKDSDDAGTWRGASRVP